MGDIVSFIRVINMGISAYKEVTEWDCEYAVHNHTYLFDGKSNILAYAPRGGGAIVVLNHPIKLDNRRRKFVKVKHKALDKLAKTFTIEEESKSEYPNWQVQSESGKTYIVSLIGNKYSCNCVGYGYRGKCKHSEQVKQENAETV